MSSADTMVDEGDGMALGEAVKRVVVPSELGQEAFRMGGDVPPVGSGGETHNSMLQCSLFRVPASLRAAT